MRALRPQHNTLHRHIAHFCINTCTHFSLYIHTTHHLCATRPWLSLCRDCRPKRACRPTALSWALQWTHRLDENVHINNQYRWGLFWHAWPCLLCRPTDFFFVRNSQKKKIGEKLADFLFLVPFFSLINFLESGNACNGKV